MDSLSVSQKIKDISAKFDFAETLVSSEVQAVVDSGVQEILVDKDEYHPIDIISITQMADDFRFSRETLQETIMYGRMVLERATQDLLLEDKEKKSGNTIAFAELTTAVLNGVKVLSQSYKDFSNVLLNMKKVQETDKPTINNTINVTENISTVELIERLKQLK